MESKQIGHVESLLPILGLIGSVKWEVKYVNVATWQVTNLLRLLEARSLVLVLGPVAVIMMTRPSGKRVAVIAACASPLIHWPSRLHQLP